jgi:hypothetical protein
MSFNSFLQPTQTLCQQDFVLVAGTLTAPIGGLVGGVRYQPFNSQTSKIIGAIGETLGGVPAFQNLNITLADPTAAITLAKGGNITIQSALAADTSTYTVFWVNSVYPGLQPC